MYQVWDADRGELVSSGHDTPESAAALIERVLADVARHAHLGHGDIALCLEVRDTAGEAVTLHTCGDIFQSPARQSDL
ncbi:hypothetical protein HNR23_002210 [Nocardiopsis mwathae]|uniref:Uncharacterized protein n=1 Tax=Nocardiopsis mwathae TaxID=1472723 RepID=A0A7W9YHB5_9ACTN|nr:hypothetical protein [Nocardiopsis mwathae]MBB6172150.1 hypothetical protein [Nocardiopsis mwathae]